MHTAHLANLRSAIQDYYQTDDSDYELSPHSGLNPHMLEHEARAAELLGADDDDAAWIHQMLSKNMKRAARSAN